MAHNQQMLEKNAEKWGSRVRIIAIAVDDEKEPVIERVNEKGWNKIEHYKIKTGWDSTHDAVKFFSVRGIPRVVLIGPDRKIAYLGHPNKGNLENRINDFLEQKPADNNVPADKKVEEVV
jgi:hypothetical protein